MIYSSSRPDFAWLNEDSRLFLQRGYLLEGTTALDRIRYIAEHAERKLGIEGYADKFFHYMARGYFSLSSPIWSNFGLDRGYQFLVLVVILGILSTKLWKLLQKWG